MEREFEVSTHSTEMILKMLDELNHVDNEEKRHYSKCRRSKCIMETIRIVVMSNSPARAKTTNEFCKAGQKRRQQRKTTL